MVIWGYSAVPVTKSCFCPLYTQCIYLTGHLNEKPATTTIPLHTVHIVWRSATLPWWSANTQRSQIFLPEDSKSQDPPHLPHDLHQVGNSFDSSQSGPQLTRLLMESCLAGSGQSADGIIDAVRWICWHFGGWAWRLHPNIRASLCQSWIAKIELHPSKVFDWEKEGGVHIKSGRSSSVSHFLGVFWICK